VPAKTHFQNTVMKLRRESTRRYVVARVIAVEERDMLSVKGETPHGRLSQKSSRALAAGTPIKWLAGTLCI
jgi:hypothetical protein